MSLLFILLFAITAIAGVCIVLNQLATWAYQAYSALVRLLARV